MKKLTNLFLLALTSAVTLNGQNVNFAIENNQLFLADGSVAGRNADNTVDNRSNLTVWAGFAQGNALTTFESALADYGTSSDAADLNTALDLITWSSVGLGSGLFINTRDFNLAGASGAFGDSALLLVTTASSFNNLSVSDEVGLLTSTTLVPELGTVTIGFETTSTWDTSYLGSLGSLQLQAVPEPSAYAAIAGLLALAWVAVRRRS